MKNILILLAVLAMAGFNYWSYRENRKLNRALKASANREYIQAEKTREITGAFTMTLNGAPRLQQLNTAALITDTNGVSVPLYSLFTEQQRLFYRIVPGNCELCTDLVMEELSKRTEKPGFEKTVILLPDATTRDLVIFKQKYSASLAVYNLPPATLHSPLDSTKYSYLFTTGKLTGLGNFFVPLYKLPDVAAQYFTSLEPFLNNANLLK
jgi:hypothetical protein